MSQYPVQPLPPIPPQAHPAAAPHLPPVPGNPAAMADLAARFAQPHYVIRQKVFKLFGNAFHIYDAAGNVVLYSKQKAFKLREDIRLYSGEDMRQEILTIKTASIIDFSAAYEVFDTVVNQRVGTLRRKGWSSLVKDAWEVLDPYGRQIGTIAERGTAMAILRRLLGGIVQLIEPQSYDLELFGRPVCAYRQNRNPFVQKLNVQIDPSSRGTLDPRLAIAAGVLLAAIEGRQQ